MQNVDSWRKGTVGVIMLNTNFPRLLGDVGNPESFACATRYRRVDVATVGAVISETGVSAQVQDAILAAAQELETEGVDLIVTSCGFLGEIQSDIDRCLKTPVLSSSLLLVPLVRAIVGSESYIGVMTFDSRRLKPLHFNGHYDDRIRIVGIEQGQELHAVISGDTPQLDAAKAEADVRAAARRLMAQTPAPRAIILECTNLSPYIAAVREETGLPVFDLMQAARWLLEARLG